MKQFLRTDWPMVAILLILSAFFVWGTAHIPFHPDETTYLFMSSDFEALFTQPESLYWEPDQAGDPRQRYRMLDAPITRYLLGLVRVVAGEKPQPIDWDWTETWDANLTAGAYPDSRLLQTVRLTVTLLLPASLGLIYLIGKRLQGKFTGLIAVLLLGTNTVVLLHGRRAMAEGALLFGVLLGTWTILRAHQQPWLAGLGMALAFNAKQSALALLPVAVIALVWLPKSTTQRFKRAAQNIIQFIFVFVLITLALNPVFWKHPVDAARSAIAARSELAAQQIEDNQRVALDKVLTSPVQRVFVLLLNLYISPPEYGLIENLHPTLEDVEVYIAMPGHNLFRGIIWGGLFLVLTLFGLYMAIRTTVVQRIENHRDLLLVLLATLSMAGGLLAAIQIYWIRYSIPLVPFVCIWIAFGLTSLISSRSNR